MAAIIDDLMIFASFLIKQALDQTDQKKTGG